jgi:hypothetical protein
VVGALVLGAGDATGAGELAIAEAASADVAGELAAADASSLAAASDPVGTASVDVAATGPAGVGFTLACLVAVEHAVSAVTVVTAAIASIRPVRPARPAGRLAWRSMRVRRGMPHADMPGAAFRQTFQAGRSGGYVTLHA